MHRGAGNDSIDQCSLPRLLGGVCKVGSRRRRYGLVNLDRRHRHGGLPPVHDSVVGCRCVAAVDAGAGYGPTSGGAQRTPARMLPGSPPLTQSAPTLQ